MNWHQAERLTSWDGQTHWQSVWIPMCCWNIKHSAGEMERSSFHTKICQAHHSVQRTEQETCCTFFTGDNSCWPAHNFPNTVPPKVDAEWKVIECREFFFFCLLFFGSGYISAFLTSLWLQIKFMWHHHCSAKKWFD